jgi:hypothetical protein
VPSQCQSLASSVEARRTCTTCKSSAPSHLLRDPADRCSNRFHRPRCWPSCGSHHWPATSREGRWPCWATGGWRLAALREMVPPVVYVYLRYEATQGTIPSHSQSRVACASPDPIDRQTRQTDWPILPLPSVSVAPHLLHLSLNPLTLTQFSLLPSPSPSPSSLLLTQKLL